MPRTPNVFKDYYYNNKLYQIPKNLVVNDILTINFREIPADTKLTQTCPPGSENKSNFGMSKGGKIGLGVGCLVLLIIIAVVFMMMKKKKAAAAAAKSSVAAAFGFRRRR